MGLLDRFKGEGQGEKAPDAGEAGAAPVGDASGDTIGAPLDADGLLKGGLASVEKDGAGNRQTELEALRYQARASEDPELAELAELENAELEGRGEE
jgi:hypothetical protein